MSDVGVVIDTQQQMKNGKLRLNPYCGHEELKSKRKNMPYRVFTLTIDESSGGFDDHEFHEFTKAHFIVSAKQEILMYKNVPYMAVFVEYQE